MRRFRVLFVVFSLALLGPLALLVDRAFHSAALERQMRHQALAERVFDEMERGLSDLIAREEERPFEQYGSDASTSVFSFVIGYFHIDPDNTIHAYAAPHTQEQAAAVTAEIERVVGTYWRGSRVAAGARSIVESQHPGTTVELDKAAGPAPASIPAETREQPKEKSRVSTFDALRALNKGVQQRADRQKDAAMEYAKRSVAPMAPRNEATTDRGAALEARQEALGAARSTIDVPPMAGRIIDPQHLLLYRTVVRSAQEYRQGALLDVAQLGRWLLEQGVGGDGLAAYASVSFATPFANPPDPVVEGVYAFRHRFAEPFADLTARLALRPLPGVGSIAYVYALSALLIATGVLGLAALYRMVFVVVSFAERRSNFVAAVSHELKTPLTAIRMYGEMLRDGMVPSEAKRDEYYRHITVESERLSRLIDNVLEFSHLEKGTRDFALATGSIAPVMRDVAELLRPHVESEGFALQVEGDADLPPVRFERDALVQVLCNLVDNAVKYARTAPVKRITLRAWHDGAGVYIAVRDRGPGVPSRHLGKIFEPFYRGEAELTRRNKGTGLGLALVRGLADRMGARVSGRNVPDGGFEVQITFRAAAT